jgi:hypothetical protein
MIGVEAPETCWATHKPSSNKLVKQLHIVGWFIWIWTITTKSHKIRLCFGLIRLHGFFYGGLQALLLSCGCFDFLYSHFHVTSSRTDQLSGMYFNKLYPRSPSGYVLLRLKTGEGLNSEMSCLLQNVDNKQSPPKKRPCQWVIPMLFFLRHYNFREVLALSTNSFHLGQFLMQSFPFVIFIFVISLLHQPPNYF